MRAFAVGLSRVACLSDNYVMPVPNWETVATNLQFYSSVNVTQYFGESIHGAGHVAEMNELRAWVQASMMWDATRDPASLVSEFVLHFYGARAAPHVMAHMDAWGRGLQSVTNWTDALSHGGFTACGADALIHPGNCYDQPWVTMQPVVESAIALRAALDALDPAFESDAIFAHRVEKVLISSWWIILMRWDEACSYATKHQLEWPLAESMAASLQGWEAATARQGIVKLCDAIPGFTAASYNDTKTAGKFCPPRALKTTDGSAATVSPSCSAMALGACNRALQQALSACPRVDCTVVIAPGDYCWSMGLPVRASGLVRLTIQAHAAVLQLTGPQILPPAILSFEDCDAVTVQGLSMAAPRPLFTMGRVTAVDNASASFGLQVDSSQYPLLSDAGPLVQPWIGQAQAILSWNPLKNRPSKDVDIYQLKIPPGSFRPLNASHAVVTVTGSYMTGKHGISSIARGQTLVVRHAVYTSVGLLFQNSSDVVVEDVTLNAAPGMGFRAERCHGVRLTRYRVARADGRALSTCADAAHFETCGGQISIDDCTFEGQGDDGTYRSFLCVFFNLEISKKLMFRHQYPQQLS